MSFFHPRSTAGTYQYSSPDDKLVSFVSTDTQGDYIKIQRKYYADLFQTLQNILTATDFKIVDNAYNEQDYVHIRIPSRDIRLIKKAWENARYKTAAALEPSTWTEKPRTDRTYTSEEMMKFKIPVSDPVVSYDGKTFMPMFIGNNKYVFKQV